MYDFVFFFSSRRRHTRSDRDWSSDVCSSDLAGTAWDAAKWGVWMRVKGDFRGRERQGRLSRSLHGRIYGVPGNPLSPAAVQPRGAKSVLARRYRSATGRRPFRRRLRRVVGQRPAPARRRLGYLARHEVLQLLLVDGLVLHERIGHRVQLVEGAGKDLARALVVALDDPAYLLVDGVRSHVRDLLVLRDAATEEQLTGLLGVGERPEPVRQAPLGDHVARQLGDR